MNSEEYLAGAILIDGENVMRDIRSIVTAECFGCAQYRAVFTAATALMDAGEPIDPVSVTRQAGREGTQLPRQLLLELMQCVPSTANCVEYAHRVAEDAQKRRIQALAARIQQDSTSTAQELLATMEREADAIRGSDTERGLLSPSDSLRRFTTHVVRAGEGQENFISTGFPRLDSLLGGGFLRGGMYILGARPAVGKSTFAIRLADQIQGKCLFVSLEMTAEQINAKRVSSLTGISSAQLLAGQVSEKDWEGIAMATGILHGKSVYMNDRYDLTVQQIHALCRSIPDLQAVIIDYLGLIQPASRGTGTYESISQISRELKRMAISLNIPVICLCQLSRKIEERRDKRPMLSDLRDSGAIEQDADGVLFLYREDYYTGERAPGGASVVGLSVAKNRHGRTGDDTFRFWLATGSVEEQKGA